MDIQEQEQKEEVTGQDTRIANPYPMTFCYWICDYGDSAVSEWVEYFKASIGTLYPDCGYATIPGKVDKDGFMRGRSQIYRKLREGIAGNLIFSDVDVVAFNRLPKDHWDGDWEIGITDSEKTWPLMPFNGGIVFAKDTPGALEFYELFQKTVNDIPEGLVVNGDWWVDQLALNYCYMALKDRVKFKIFPWQMYNFFPDGEQATDAYFVHCKGPERKHLLRQYLATLLGTDHFSFQAHNKPREV